MSTFKERMQYGYNCVKCGVDYVHDVQYLGPGAGNFKFIGPCLVVTCQICGYQEKRTPVDGES